MAWNNRHIPKNAKPMAGVSMGDVADACCGDCFWLTTNLTDNAALIAENPGRVVFPALVILLGIVAIFTRRDLQPTDIK